MVRAVYLPAMLDSWGISYSSSKDVNNPQTWYWFYHGGREIFKCEDYSLDLAIEQLLLKLGKEWFRRNEDL